MHLGVCKDASQVCCNSFEYIKQPNILIRHHTYLDDTRSFTPEEEYSCKLNMIKQDLMYIESECEVKKSMAHNDRNKIAFVNNLEQIREFLDNPNRNKENFYINFLLYFLINRSARGVWSIIISSISFMRSINSCLLKESPRRAERSSTSTFSYVVNAICDISIFFL